MEFDRELLVRTFAEEGEEHLTAMEEGLMALEARPRDPEVLGALFRAAHTLKGSSASVGLGAVADFAHGLEDVLEPLRRQVRVADTPLVSLLLRACDVLRRLIELSASGSEELPPELHAVAAQLRQAAQGGAPVASPPVPAELPSAQAPSAHVPGLRVEGAKLDRMLDLVGEIAVGRARVGTQLELLGSAGEPAAEALQEMDRLFLGLQELVLQARLVPLTTAFRPLQRTVRDLALELGKQVRLQLDTGNVELDTSVVERLRDPLGHMLRNALVHGIEAPELRQARGKEPTGLITLRAFQEGSSVVVELADDGRGLDRRRMLERARALGWVGADEQPAPERLDRLIFEAGFSTSERLTGHAGRGVGLDVVRRNIESLRGTVEARSTEGAGTVFTLRLPLTLAIIQGFRVQVGTETYVLPLEVVSECLDLPPEAAGQDRATGLLHLRGHGLPFLRLREHFGLGGQRPARESVVVVHHGQGRAGLVVDALLGEGQTVVKPLGRLFRRLPGISGTVILGDGRVALILDVPTLMKRILETA